MKWDNVLVLSDLHLCEGPQSANEDFFFDEEFAALLKNYNKNSLLVLNGDIIDFLQVMSKGSFKDITYNENRFGLGTAEEKSVYKLRVVQRAHRKFFKGLADFLKCGNDCVLLPGNHDVEFFWPNVRQAWVRELVKLGVKDAHKRMSFKPWSFHIPNVLYVEHGHQYDPTNAFDHHLYPVLPSNHKLLDLPLGSFLVRYFFNQLEDSDPLADNFRPPTKYVSLMVRKDPVYVIQVLGKYIPFLFRTWLKSLRRFSKRELRAVREHHNRVFREVSRDEKIKLPILSQIAGLQQPGFMHRPFFWMNTIRSHLWTVSVPAELNIALKIKRLLSVKYVVMGHTHHAYEAKGYLNSGTWTQMVTHHGYYEIGQRLTYVHITKDSAKLRTWH